MNYSLSSIPFQCARRNKFNLIFTSPEKCAQLIIFLEGYFQWRNIEIWDFIEEGRNDFWDESKKRKNGVLSRMTRAMKKGFAASDYIS